ncbi:MAG: hypothetical protein PHQ18_04710 [Patescibacteria group bacterium]|nr:hypothetical protein [Patescibacteria group bacterium]
MAIFSKKRVQSSGLLGLSLILIMGASLSFPNFVGAFFPGTLKPNLVYFDSSASREYITENGVLKKFIKVKLILKNSGRGDVTEPFYVNIKPGYLLCGADYEYTCPGMDENFPDVTEIRFLNSSGHYQTITSSESSFNVLVDKTIATNKSVTLTYKFELDEYYVDRFGDGNFYISYDMDVTDTIIELDENNLFGLKMSEFSEGIHFHSLIGQYGYIPPSHN